MHKSKDLKKNKNKIKSSMKKEIRLLEDISPQSILNGIPTDETIESDFIPDLYTIFWSSPYFDELDIERKEKESKGISQKALRGEE